MIESTEWLHDELIKSTKWLYDESPTADSPDGKHTLVVEKRHIVDYPHTYESYSLEIRSLTNLIEMPVTCTIDSFLHHLCDSFAIPWFEWKHNNCIDIQFARAHFVYDLPLLEIQIAIQQLVIPVIADLVWGYYAMDMKTFCVLCLPSTTTFDPEDCYFCNPHSPSPKRSKVECV